MARMAGQIPDWNQCRDSEIRFILAASHNERISEPDDTRIISLLASSDSEVRIRGRREILRASEAKGHQRL